MKEIIDSKGESLPLDYKDFYDVKRQVSEAQYVLRTNQSYVMLLVFGLSEGLQKYSGRSLIMTQNSIPPNFLQKRALKSLGQSFLRKSKPTGITTAKKENIKVILPHLNENRKQFWLDLPPNDFSKDLSVERDPEEEENQESFYVSFLLKDLFVFVKKRVIE